MHPCDGKCGRPVSNNKRKCLECLAIELSTAMWRKGEPITLVEARRVMRLEAGA